MSHNYHTRSASALQSPGASVTKSAMPDGASNSNHSNHRRSQSLTIDNNYRPRVTKRWQGRTSVRGHNLSIRAVTDNGGIYYDILCKYQHFSNFHTTGYCPSNPQRINFHLFFSFFTSFNDNQQNQKQHHLHQHQQQLED